MALISSVRSKDLIESILSPVKKVVHETAVLLGVEPFDDEVNDEVNEEVNEEVNDDEFYVEQLDSVVDNSSAEMVQHKRASENLGINRDLSREDRFPNSHEESSSVINRSSENSVFRAVSNELSEMSMTTPSSGEAADLSGQRSEISGERMSSVPGHENSEVRKNRASETSGEIRSDVNPIQHESSSLKTARNSAENSDLSFKVNGEAPDFHEITEVQNQQKRTASFSSSSTSQLSVNRTTAENFNNLNRSDTESVPMSSSEQNLRDEKRFSSDLNTPHKNEGGTAVHNNQNKSPLSLSTSPKSDIGLVRADISSEMSTSQNIKTGNFKDDELSENSSSLKLPLSENGRSGTGSAAESEQLDNSQFGHSEAVRKDINTGPQDNIAERSANRSSSSLKLPLSENKRSGAVSEAEFEQKDNSQLTYGEAVRRDVNAGEGADFVEKTAGNPIPEMSVPKRVKARTSDSHILSSKNGSLENRSDSPERDNCLRISKHREPDVKGNSRSGGTGSVNENFIGNSDHSAIQNGNSAEGKVNIRSDEHPDTERFSGGNSGFEKIGSEQTVFINNSPEETENRSLISDSLYKTVNSMRDKFATDENGKVNSTVNLNLNMHSNNASINQEDVEDALMNILYRSARKQGLDI